MNLQKIIKIQELACERIDEILQYLNIEYIEHHKYYSFPCPIHGSDNKGSCSIYKTTGIWGCWTNSCQEEYGKTFFDFIKAVFISQGKQKTISEIATLCAYILKTDLSNIKEIKDYELKISSTKIVNELIKERKLLSSKLLRKTIREKLYIPAQYYIKRGYSEEILDKYDVGLCTTYGKEMFARIVVPIYDDSHKFMVGCVGRSQYKQCEKCKTYHSPNYNCPSNKLEEMWAVKWKNSKGFRVDNYLYNYWFAKEYIKQSKTAILVEGQGDVWRLEEAGIKNSLGVFGANITDGQKIILEKSGAYNLIIASDNDKAGNNFRNKIHERCSRTYNIIDVFTTKKDFGEMTIEETKQLMKGIKECPIF